MTASAAISSMHMMMRRPMRFTPRQLRAPDKKSDAFRIALFEPSVGGFVIGKDLEMVDVADLGAGVDLDQDCHWSLLSLRFPQMRAFAFRVEFHRLVPVDCTYPRRKFVS
jgi:hypothetical protein